MASRLTEILARVQQRVEHARSTVDRAQLRRRAESHRPRGFRRALLAAAGLGGWPVIAELKRASPSRGLIRQDFPVRELARGLESAGAAALSVLTDEEFFQGSLTYLDEASKSTRLPCLRKDFIVDELQLLQARAHGGDAVLLIAAALSPPELRKLHARARELGLDVLCEVHSREELEAALAAGCNTIGVNSRDLRTFTVDLETPLRLAPLLPAHVLRVAESGIQNGSDLIRLREAGYQAFLVGESLMRAASPADALRGLLAQAGAPQQVPSAESVR